MESDDEDAPASTSTAKTGAGAKKGAVKKKKVSGKRRR